MPQPSSPRFIQSTTELQSFCELASHSPWLAIDTEFVREKTYYPELCLIQLATEQGDIACIDTLAIDDLRPLFDLFANPAITKILHAVSQDLEVLYQAGAPQIQPLFDTQVAAGLLGMADQIGYAGLVEKLTGVTLAKGHARTDWSRRPLSNEQLAYAADDVRYLGQLYSQLTAQLDEQARGDWLREDMQAISQPANYEVDTSQIWRRLKGLGRLPAQAQHRAAKLAAWREKQAIESNRPRRWILADAELLELANQAPDSLAELQALPLHEKFIQRHAETILPLLAEQESDQLLVKDWQKPSPEEKATQKRLKAKLREVAEQLEIGPALLATRSDIEGLQQGQRDLPVLRGWRKGVIGDALLDALDS
ncbi:MAG: ribonuclease D [Salinisphaeraceae bacterium]|nr:ribonuclease D [Salinisphaeraceae bacterium]